MDGGYLLQKSIDGCLATYQFRSSSPRRLRSYFRWFHSMSFPFTAIAQADNQGLPPSWSKLLTSSAITKEEAARNPEAVIDVLQFYTTQQMGASAGDYQAMPVPTMPSQSRTTSSAATRFEGVGLAGQQQQQRDRERAREKTQQAIAPSRAPPPRQNSDSFRAEVCHSDLERGRS